MPNQTNLADIKHDLIQVQDEASRLLAKWLQTFQKNPELGFGFRDYWKLLSDEQRKSADQIAERLKELGAKLFPAAKVSPLLSEADEVELREGIRRMLSALRLRRYYYNDPYVVSEEDRVFGIRPASHHEEDTLPSEAAEQLQRGYEVILDKIGLMSPTTAELPAAMVASERPTVKKYRPNTAFMIMSMHRDNPELEDVKNSIKDVFRVFGIKALRADDIEHQDVITKRILDEIATSEFLIADLTGERPSVYYEVGYAHAIDKRPILYRKKGTPLHFDLSVHNVPEYENLTDLRKKLHKRLVALTNKEIPPPD